MKNTRVAYFNTNDGTGILAFGEESSFVKQTSDGDILALLQSFIDQNAGNFIISCLSYDLKEEIEKVKSENEDNIDFPLVYFWVPRYVVELKGEKYKFIQGEKCQESFEFLNYFLEEETDQNFHPYQFHFKSRITKKQYIKEVNELKKELQKGNIYEVNFCQEYYAENCSFDYPFDAYFKLNKITKAPFSVYLNTENHLVMCGSPERFLKKEGKRLFSQPIKGTAKRGETAEEDRRLIQDLNNNQKEVSENVMIVDLVRNDLSRIAEKDTVKVDELCRIYTFETVHQMISTISCSVDEKISFCDILKATFPMGSMTGAPKHSALKLIERHEVFKRGLYSGSIGFIHPNGDFDLNVVIRSLIYNKEKKYLSCGVGSAITILSDPEQEYDECLIKVKRILDGMNE